MFKFFPPDYLAHFQHYNIGPFQMHTCMFCVCMHTFMGLDLTNAVNSESLVCKQLLIFRSVLSSPLSVKLRCNLQFPHFRSWNLDFFEILST